MFCPTVRIRSILMLSSLLQLWLQPTNALPSGRVNTWYVSSPTSDPLEKPRDLTLFLPSLPSFPPGPTSSGKNNNKVFFIVLGSISLYLYVRRLRERTKRNEHREKAWQFKDMKRNGLRPTLN
ncbi:hypothetical protein BGY98DRAFT_938406 [Russula aff. rugulosa BPL654]|nr:hypothetical protein BGY98DRAFT_938406 [Russula aff. rugulosa BPL654]